MANCGDVAELFRFAGEAFESLAFQTMQLLIVDHQQDQPNQPAAAQLNTPNGFQPNFGVHPVNAALQKRNLLTITKQRGRAEVTEVLKSANLQAVRQLASRQQVRVASKQREKN